jgi:hypothetical protein
LNAAEWFRLGFLMDFVPPVMSLPGSKSTYTRVRKTGATSQFSEPLVGGQFLFDLSGVVGA